MPRYYQLPKAERADLLAAGQGLLGENYDRQNARVGIAVTSGTIYVAGVGLRAGDVVTNVVVDIPATAGSGITANKVGVYDKTGARVAISADLGTSWQSIGVKVNALSSAYTVSLSDMYYLAFIVVFSTTAAQPIGANQSGLGAGAGAGARNYALQAGQSDLISNLTLANSANAYWMGWS